MPTDINIPATASLQRRLAAMLYDSMLLLALLFVASIPVVMIAGGSESPFITGAGFSLYLYSISFVFYGWFWTHGGQTLGMRSWKLQVIRDDMHALGWDSALMRYLAATVSLLLFGIGFLWILFNNERLAWHDQLSKTRIMFNPGSGKKAAKS